MSIGAGRNGSGCRTDGAGAVLPASSGRSENKMKASFETIWSSIQHRLQPGTLVRNWGLSRGFTGGSFTIDDMERAAITVRGGKMATPRRVSKGEFEKLYAVWDQYLADNLPRSRMLPLSQNITYILSIFHLIHDPSP
jgi:hypothetical protein